MSLTIAVPKQGKLRKPFNELLKSGGFEYIEGSQLIIDKKGVLPDISTRILKDSAAIANLCEEGPANITLAPIGLNAYKEFTIASQKTPPISIERTTDVSQCTLCLAGTSDDNVIEKGMGAAQGRTIVTSYPSILEEALKAAGIQSITLNQDGTRPTGPMNAIIYPEKLATILVRPGSVEEEAALRGALACDLVQTGNSLREEGFDTQTMLPILESSLVFAKSQVTRLTNEEEEIIGKFLERVVPIQQTSQITGANPIKLIDTPRTFAYA